MIHWLDFEEVKRHVHHWIEHGGYAALFGLLFSCGLGMPLPEDVPLIVAGAMVAHGHFNLFITAICAWCGIIGGDCVLYWLGKTFGDDVPNIPVIGRHVSARRMRKVEKLFDRWGIWVVAIGRMFAGIRGAMVVVAGASHFKFWKFIVADGLAAVVSGGLFLYLGYEFGTHINKLNEHVETAKRYILLIVVSLAVILGSFIWWKSRQEHDEEDEQPQPQTPQNIVE